MGLDRRRRAATWLLVAFLGVAGCTGANSDTDPTTPGSTPTTRSSSPTPDPQAALKAQVLAAYRNFWTAATAAEARPQGHHPQLAKFASDKALASEQATLVLYRQQGIVGRGQARLSPEVASVSLNPGVAVIRDCLDLTGMDVVYRSNGKSAIAPNQLRRHPATARAALADGRWVITELVANRKQSC